MKHRILSVVWLCLATNGRGQQITTSGLPTVNQPSSPMTLAYREGPNRCPSQSPEEPAVGTRLAFPDAQCGVRPARTSRTWFRAFLNGLRILVRIFSCLWDCVDCSSPCSSGQLTKMQRELP